MKIYKKTFITFLIILFSQISFSQEKLSYEDYRSKQLKKEKEILNKDYVSFSIDTLSNNDLLNKVTIINFWYESCTPCIAEMEGLNKLYDKNKENENFQFISFCTDNTETINKNLEKFAIKYNITAIERVRARELNYNSGFPTTLIINKRGKVVYFASGGLITIEKATEKIMSIYDKIINEELEKS